MPTERDVLLRRAQEAAALIGMDLVEHGGRAVVMAAVAETLAEDRGVRTQRFAARDARRQAVRALIDEKT